MNTELQTFSVRNAARDQAASCQVAFIEPTSHYVKDMIELLSRHVGVWLNPFRGIPMTPNWLRFDAIYLDEDNRIMQEVASFPNPRIEAFELEPASALLLPRHTDFAEQAQPDDQLTLVEVVPVFAAAQKQASPSTVAAASEPPEPVVGPHLVEPSRGEPISPHHALQMEDALHQLEASDVEEQRSRSNSFYSRFLRWLNDGRDPADRRKATRRPIDGLFAYFWTGGTPAAMHVANISDQGLYLLTPERPLMGTIVLMVIQRMDHAGEHPVDTVALHAEVARWGTDGIGFSFIMPRLSGDARTSIARASGWDVKALKDFLERLDLPVEELEQELSA